MSRITCKNCGEKNERKFDKCWNCEWPLIASEAKSAEVRRGQRPIRPPALGGAQSERLSAALVSRLAAWSRRWPREMVYSMSRQPECDGELIAIEEEAKRLFPEAPQKVASVKPIETPQPRAEGA